MNRIRVILLATVLSLGASRAHAAGSDDAFDCDREPVAAFLADRLPYEPLRIFDNLHYVGIGWVGAWLVTTSEGLVLIDTLYGRHTRRMLDRIEAMNLHPAGIRYVFVTHAHFDHAGGIEDVYARTQAITGMTGEDWTGYRADHPRSAASARAITIVDGREIPVGDTTFKFYKTPGHLDGVLSIRFPVRDESRGREHEAFIFGGAGLNFAGAARTQTYIDSLDRIMALDDFDAIDVNLPSHLLSDSGLRKYLKVRLDRPGDRHPFVDPHGLRNFLSARRQKAQDKLERWQTQEAAAPFFFHRRRGG